MCILHNVVPFVDLCKFMSFVNKNSYNICRILNNTEAVHHTEISENHLGNVAFFYALFCHMLI
jgi:hypothetical protein